MIKEYKTKTNIYIGLSILLPILCFPLILFTFIFFGVALEISSDTGGVAVHLFTYLIHLVLLITGCVFYAKAKRQSPAWGALGLLSLLGLIVLICLKDKSKEE